MWEKSHLRVKRGRRHLAWVCQTLFYGAMCGRYSLTTPLEAMSDLFGFVERPNLAPRYNIAPTQQVAAVRLGDDGVRHLVQLRWGLVPGWAKEAGIGSRMINARAESVAEKPAFRAAFSQRRCLIPADGFYEWQAAGEGRAAKQPYRITLADGGPFGFAGLWESWRDPQSDERIESCTIVTTEASEGLRSIHPRMPVVLPPKSHAVWLDSASGSEAALALLRPYSSETLVTTAISTRVNKAANDDPSVIEPLEQDTIGDGVTRICPT